MGYLMVSRALLMDIFEKQTVTRDDEEAFLKVLLHVNYRNAVVLYNGKPMDCARGESVITFSGWASILGWGRGHTRGFFERCIAQGSIEKVPGPCPSHIRVTHYDGWTGNQCGKQTAQKAVDEDLKLFMDKYSQVTHLPTENKGLISMEWKKLSTHERELALKKIEDYYYSLNDVRYCLRAAGYLKQKAFDNDFLY